MEERLVIQKFGPIREAEVTVRDLTIFVGPQATGKSLAAQVLYFLRGIEDLLLPESGLLHKELEAVLSALEWWLGNPVAVYVNRDTQLQWNSKELTNEIAYRIWWDNDGIHLSEELSRRIWWWMESFERSRLGHNSGFETLWDTPKQVYIPAGRTLYSFLPPYSRIVQRSTQQWPGSVITFYETLGRTVTELWQANERERVARSEMETSDELSEIDFVYQRIESIVKGQIRYGPETILLDIGKKQLRSATIAAGQMETWPFWAMIEAGLVSDIQIYFEEPEAHLHPGAQRSVMEIVAYQVQQGARFLLTTHSPYILYAVNNFLMAQKVLSAGKSLPSTVSRETVLRPDQVAAYRFSPDGTVHDIMDAEVGLIDGNELDQVADELGATFTRLQERLGETR